MNILVTLLVNSFANKNYYHVERDTRTIVATQRLIELRRHSVNVNEIANISEFLPINGREHNSKTTKGL